MRKKDAKEKIEKAGGSWEIFSKWMRGQTCGIYPDGATDYYEYDVNRFIRYKCNPDNEPPEEWD
jgi:hypothetical protein